MKKLLTLFMATVAVMAGSFVGAGVAAADNETATSDVTITPRGGTFYQAGDVSADWGFKVGIRAPWPASPKVKPLKNVRLQLPSDLKFNPNNSKTPVCPDTAIGPNVDLAVSPDVAIARCPSSVIGNGKATLYLAKNNMPTVPPEPGSIYVPRYVDDAMLVAFNGGRDSDGDPIIKIYGYSFKTDYGVYIHAVFKNNVFDVRVPMLSQDSAVANFDLDIPGKDFVVTDNFNKKITVKGGQDPDFVQARCSTGNWSAKSSFTLGERDVNTGADVGGETEVTAPDQNWTCTAKPGTPKPPGKAKLGRLVVKGPKAVKRGKKGTFRVTVRNTGKAPATNVVVRTKGGAVKAGRIAAGKAKTVRVKAKVAGKRGKRVTLTFRASAKGVKAVAGKVRVRVR